MVERRPRFIAEYRSPWSTHPTVAVIERAAQAARAFPRLQLVTNHPLPRRLWSPGAACAAAAIAMGCSSSSSRLQLQFQVRLQFAQHQHQDQQRFARLPACIQARPVPTNQSQALRNARASAAERRTRWHPRAAALSSSWIHYHHQLLCPLESQRVESAQTPRTAKQPPLLTLNASANTNAKDASARRRRAPRCHRARR